MKKLLIASLLLITSAWLNAAQQSVGKVILSFGQNIAESPVGEQRALKRQGEIFADDLLKTSDKGRLQIRFTDGSRLSLKPNTVFKIEQYEFQDASPEDGKAIYKLLKGGMRTISGKIGKVDREDYKLDTVVATIGIRGTDFTIDKTGDRVTGSVNSGRINVSANAGTSSKDISPGRSFLIVGAAGQVSDFKTPPADSANEEGESDSDKEDEQEGSDEESENAGDDSESTSEETESTTDSEAGSESEGSTTDGTASSPETENTLSLETTTTTTSDSSGSTGTVPASDPTTGENQATNTSAPNPTGTGSLAPSGTVAAVAFITNESGKGTVGNSGSLKVDGQTQLMVDSNRVTGIYYIDPSPSDTNSCNPCTFSAESSSHSGAGSHTNDGANIYWGRWDSGFVLVENGTQRDVLKSFFYIYSDLSTPLSTLQNKTGSYTYSAISGKGFAETEGGITGSVDYTSTVTVNWSSQSITGASLTLNGFSDSRNYSLSASDPLSVDQAYAGSELKIAGSCTGGGCASTGEFEGRMTINFVGNNAGNIISGFSANEKSDAAAGTVSDSAVSGTAIFQ